MVQASAVNWASSVTFGALAGETSIDQAQIARDFGSKDELAADLIRHLFRPDAFAHFDDHVGEFVENDLIRKRLQQLGIDYAQGYGIARPKPLGELNVEAIDQLHRAAAS